MWKGEKYEIWKKNNHKYIELRRKDIEADENKETIPERLLWFEADIIRFAVLLKSSFHSWNFVLLSN